MIRSLALPEARNRRRMLLALLALAAATAVLAACGSSGTPSGTSSGGGSSAHAAAPRRPEDRQDRQRDSADQRQGLHALLVRPRHAHQIELQRSVRAVLAAGEGAVSASGVKGTFGTIKRSNGSLQATFDGHPLYTYVGDTAPGQAKGNGLNLSGGVWHEVTTSGSAPAGSSSSGSGGGGSGY